MENAENSGFEAYFHHFFLAFVSGSSDIYTALIKAINRFNSF
ncbi:MAG: hypothetical protein P8Y99_07650 [Calditrichaceae bacterium]